MLQQFRLAASTMWQALFAVAELKAGQTLLVHGAAGGLGVFAVQFAKAKGVRVIGTASGQNQSFVRDLGVDEPRDYTKTKFEDVAHDVDVVLDTQRGSAPGRC
jgi:NADPH:quinone reductase-like Zn-dependent oxidoreductase